jgi:hypothetical protein
MLVGYETLECAWASPANVIGVLCVMHLVVYHHSSLHNTPVHRYIPYVP